MTELYTNNPMTQRLDQARSVFGNNPADVARGVASNMTNSATFQDPLKSQQNALGAMDQIAAYDKELAGRFQQGNQQAMQANTQNNAMLTSFAGAGATPQDTITKGAAAIPTTPVQSFNGILSPFVSSGLASGQQQAATDVFNMASQTRAALEKVVGTEAQAYADALRFTLQEEARKQEEERLAKEAEDRKLQAQFDNALALAKLTGQTAITDPRDGKTYNIVGEGVSITDQLNAIKSGYEIVNGQLVPVNEGGQLSKNQIDELLEERKIRLDQKLGTDDIDAKLRTSGILQDTGERQKIVNLIDDILKNPNHLNSLYGDVRLGGIPVLNRAKVQATNAKLDQLVGQTVLENRQKLKGQGQISDKETAMLERASTILSNRQQDTQSVVDELTQMRNQLSTNIFDTTGQDVGEAPVVPQNSGLLDAFNNLKSPVSGASASLNAGGNIRVRNKATGQTGSIPANEFDENLYERI